MHANAAAMNGADLGPAIVALTAAAAAASCWTCHSRGSEQRRRERKRLVHFGPPGSRLWEHGNNCELQPLKLSNELFEAADSEGLQQRIKRDGYVYLTGVLDRSQVLAAKVRKL
eukprot:SAG31_NODE_26363_length_443_cov_1.648256_1_plen_113_part_01